VWGHFCEDGQTCQLADVDGDGSADLVATGGSSFPAAWVARAGAGGFGEREMWSDFLCDANNDCRRGADVALGDVDGDHRADAVLFPHDPEEVVVARSVAHTRPLFHGGAVIDRTPTVHLLWYGDWSASPSMAILPDFVGALSGSPYPQTVTSYQLPSTPWTAPASQWTLGASVALGTPHGTVLDDVAVRAVVSQAIDGGQVPLDTNAIYVVLASPEITEIAGHCDAYCGYHSFVPQAEGTLKYVFLGSPSRCPAACAPQLAGGSPNGDFASDALANLLAHELLSVMTSPELDGWYSSSGAEGADLCNFAFGPTTPSANGAPSNVRAGARDYLLQENWVLGAGSCALAAGR
jgi:hypothetical protein